MPDYDSEAEREGRAISKSSDYTTTTPKRVRATMKEVPRHLRTRSTPPVPLVKKEERPSWLEGLFDVP